MLSPQLSTDAMTTRFSFRAPSICQGFYQASWRRRETAHAPLGQVIWAQVQQSLWVTVRVSVRRARVLSALQLLRQQSRAREELLPVSATRPRGPRAPAASARGAHLHRGGNAHRTTSAAQVWSETKGTYVRSALNSRENRSCMHSWHVRM